MKQITELTVEEAEEILSYVYPNEDCLNVSLSFSPKIDKQGVEQITFSGLSIVGIRYRSSTTLDGLLLPFNNSKAVSWLYQHGYDVGELLKENEYLSEFEQDFDDFVFRLLYLTKRRELLAKNNSKVEWTVEKFEQRCKELVDELYYKDFS